MRTSLILSVVFAAFLAVPNLGAHCQVPCGIYGDQLRFQSMLEDQTTIAKASEQIGELVQENTGQNANQAARWVVTKEEHAQRIQDTIAAYFMAQRIKPDAEGYAETLQAAHEVMRAAMKTKQQVSEEAAEALKEAIFDLYRAYEGKEPDFHEH